MRTDVLKHLTTTTRASVIASGSNGFACQINRLRIIVSWGGGWEHVSVSLPDRCPTWPEMQFIKMLMWNDDECVVQYHPPKPDYVNCHEYCLHLWRPTNAEIPRPPSWMVGPQNNEQGAPQ